MKRLLILLMSLALCSRAFGIWAMVPLNDLVTESDTIIIGTLIGVRVWSKDNMDYGSGTLIITETMKGVPKSKELSLTWNNQSDITCPRIEHKHSEGKLLIWLLTTTTAGVEANYPGKVLEISERAKVEAELMTVKFKLLSLTRR